MPRKNNPRQTVESILAVSSKLFLEKGYDQTSMQNIVDALGMSKGAIFHHFGSKEEIFNAVMHRQFEASERKMREWLDEMERAPDRLTARERIARLFEWNIKDRKLHAFDKVFVSMQKSPHILVANMLDGVNKSAPLLAKLIKEGIADGSIQTEFPDECAQAVFLLFNIWCDHVIFECDMGQLRRRLVFLQQTLKAIGADIFSDDLITEYLRFLDSMRAEAQRNG